ncbi:mycophenolic acid acyl-glucuronide esterase, mitochondrial-like isoform X1 [Callorhinchus milii]|nr:mycophenolic acid acyl-glucuronide esterase, mitochondrial-like isoform X1 [Callorhinchus milii]
MGGVDGGLENNYRALNASDMACVQFLTRQGLPPLAYFRSCGQNPGVVFLTGFRSNMNGMKALALEEYCRSEGRSFVRFDYTGCGSSKGDADSCFLGNWKNDVLSVLDNLTTGPQVLVGSSMGGWLMLLAGLARPEKIVGLVGIATATDHFVNAYKQLPLESRQEAERTGQWTVASKYADSGFYTIKMDFVKEAEDHCLLQGTVPISCPVRLIHGMEDELVPWQNSVHLAERLASRDVDLLVRRSGDHRMTRDEDIQLLVAVVRDLVGKIERNGLKS